MHIVYRDEGGYKDVAVAGEINFLDGEAYFDDGAEDYRIKVEYIVGIWKED